MWRAIPAPTGSHTYPMVSRLDLFKEHAGIDLQELFPAGERDQAKVDAEWTYDNFLEAAKKLHAAGHPFGNPIGPTSDSQDWLGPAVPVLRRARWSTPTARSRSIPTPPGPRSTTCSS